MSNGENLRSIIREMHELSLFTKRNSFVLLKPGTRKTMANQELNFLSAVKKLLAF